MRLYLVQHGEAKPKEEDPDRSLTAKGEGDVRRVAALAKRAGIKVSQIRHSGKRRAEQTATILAKQLHPPRGVAAKSGLDPKDDVKPVAKALADESDDLLIVGHLPFLERLAARLVGGDPEQELVRFQMGGIVCLERWEESRWAIAWMVTPDLLREE